MKKYNLILSFLFLILLTSCTSRSYMYMADNLYNEGKSFKSCEQYANAYYKLDSRDKLERADLAEKIGDIYTSVKDYRKAYIWYRKSLSTKDTVFDRCQKVLNTAFYLKRINDIDRYEKRYHVKRKQNDSIISSIRYVVKPFDIVNSRFDDYSPSFRGGDANVLFFSSNRTLYGKNGKKKSLVTGDYFSDIYRTQFTDEFIQEIKKKGNKKKIVPVYKTVYLDEIQWIKPIRLKDSVANSPVDDGVLCCSLDGKKAFFTTSRRLKGRFIGAKIYSADVNNKFELKNPSLLNIVGDSINIGHPAISPDGKTLCFAANMDGGYGGTDIWYSIKRGAKWLKPVNLGKEINSSGNEAYPYFNEKGELFIASDGHGGLGGLDIFKVIGDYGSYELKNLASPINSSADDFGVIYRSNKDSGFFTSSRGKKGDTDIYSFEYSPFKFSLDIKIFDKRLNLPLEGVLVKMIDSNGKSVKVRTDDNGFAKINWKDKSEVSFSINHSGYFKTSFTIDTKHNRDDENFARHLNLNRIDAIIEVQNIFYDFGLSTLREKSKIALKELVELLNDNPNITIELGAHTDMVGDVDDNQTLSQARAQSVIDYLIKNGIDKERLIPVGYGESTPKTVSKEDANKYTFLQSGQHLSPAYISTLTSDQQDVVGQLNRRTEFKVISLDYISNKNINK